MSIVLSKTKEDNMAWRIIGGVAGALIGAALLGGFGYIACPSGQTLGMVLFGVIGAMGFGYVGQAGPNDLR